MSLIEHLGKDNPIDGGNLATALEGIGDGIVKVLEFLQKSSLVQSILSRINIIID